MVKLLEEREARRGMAWHGTLRNEMRDRVRSEGSLRMHYIAREG